MPLGNLIAAKRKEAGLTQDQFAEIMGVARQTVSSWENNIFLPDTLKIMQIAKYFQCTTDYFLNPSLPPETGEQEPRKKKKGE